MHGSSYSQHSAIRPNWLASQDEDVIDPGLPIVDAHHHIYDRPGLGLSPPRSPHTTVDAGRHARELGALLATANVHGERRSRIVAELPPGSIVTTPRHQVQWVATENGIASVFGRSQRERGTKPRSPSSSVKLLNRVRGCSRRGAMKFPDPWRRSTKPSATSASIALRSANNRCTGAVPAYLR